MKKVTLLAWIRTIELLIKHRFDTKKAGEETDKELTETVSDIVLKTAYTGKEKDN